MRNLKKVLSLSLALVMLLGMMVVGAGAVTALDVYSDKGDITYKEAVDLLTALDVLQGDAGGFRPTDTLTREEAAKIVAYTALGVDAAEALTVTKAPFADVAATRWSAGYIAYCANVGIINGMGDNTFRPTDKVTGYQMAKMLLCVVGYGVNNEYTGSNWSLNVAKDGVTTGLFNRLSNVGNTPATREEAAQLAFNAITRVSMVAYSSLYGTYSAYSNEFGKQELLGYKVDKIFNATAVPTVDDYGYNYQYWRFKNKAAAITDTYLTDTILGTETAGTWGSLYKGYVWEDTVEIVENGQSVRNGNKVTLGDGQLDAVITSYDNSGVATGWASAFRSEALRNVSIHKAIAYNGQTVTVVDVDGDGEADKLIVVTSYLAEVTKVNAATASTARSVNVKAYIPSVQKTVTATIETEDYEKGDYILVDPSMILADVKIDLASVSDSTKAPAALKAAFTTPCGTQLAEAVTGTVSTFYKLNMTVPSVTSNGVRYEYNGIFQAENSGAKLSAALGYAYASDGYTLSSATYNFYLDKAGYVVGVNVVEDSISDLVYIIAVGEDQFELSNVVRTVNNEGVVKTYNVSTKSSAGLYDITDRDSNPNDGLRGDNEGVGYIYAYSIDANDEIILTRLSNNYTSIGEASMTKDGMKKGFSSVVYTDGELNATGAASAGVVYATDATEFIFVDSKGVVSRFTGKNNIPALAAAGYNNVVAIATQAVGSTTYAAMVVIGGAPAVSYSNYIYIVDYLGQHQGNVYFYDVILDGEFVRVAATNNNLVTGDLYSYTVNADAFTGDAVNNVKSGLYSMLTDGSGNGTLNEFTDTVAVAPTNNNLVLELNDEYQLAEKVEITDVSTYGINGLVETEATVAPGDYVTVYAVNKEIKAIYITNVDSAYLSAIDYSSNNTAAGTLYRVTTGITQNEGTAAAYTIYGKSTMTVGQLRNLITTTDGANTTITVSAISGGVAMGDNEYLTNGITYNVVITNKNDHNTNTFELTFSSPAAAATLSVKVVDGDDGYTVVTTPTQNQKLSANIVDANGTTVIGTYPVNPAVTYKWYDTSATDQVLGSDPVYTVTNGNVGDTIAVDVTYNGTTMTWTATGAVS